jgi:hypothetical protein
VKKASTPPLIPSQSTLLAGTKVVFVVDVFEQNAKKHKKITETFFGENVPGFATVLENVAKQRSPRISVTMD